MRVFYFPVASVAVEWLELPTPYAYPATAIMGLLPATDSAPARTSGHRIYPVAYGVQFSKLQQLMNTVSEI